jgi:hypothetical protein
MQPGRNRLSDGPIIFSRILSLGPNLSQSWPPDTDNLKSMELFTGV